MRFALRRPGGRRSAQKGLRRPLALPSTLFPLPPFRPTRPRHLARSRSLERGLTPGLPSHPVRAHSLFAPWSEPQREGWRSFPCPCEQAARRPQLSGAVPKLRALCGPDLLLPFACVQGDSGPLLVCPSDSDMSCTSRQTLPLSFLITPVVSSARTCCLQKGAEHRAGLQASWTRPCRVSPYRAADQGLSGHTGTPGWGHRGFSSPQGISSVPGLPFLSTFRVRELWPPVQAAAGTRL